jgi:diaminopimelate epimerase
MLRFVKAHGLGNDFLVVDLRRSDDPAAPQSPHVVRALCDRRFGVGGDGVLAILPPTDSTADCRMRVLNADGSEAEMCGNGIRCVAKHLVEQDPAFRGRRELRVETLAGVLPCGILAAPDGRVREVSVGMGRPRLLGSEIPMVGAAGERFVEQPIEGVPGRATAVSMGNPHIVYFVDETGPALRALAEERGPAVERHPWFPQRTNVELARVTPEGDIELVVWERGCGITLACGTGACATAVAATLTGRAARGRELRVRLLGGELTITVAEDGEVTMRGPATVVFEAEIDLLALAASQSI